MFIDASVIVAILAREAGWKSPAAELHAYRGRVFHSPMVRFEALIALARIGQANSGLRPSAEMFAGAEQLFDDLMVDRGSTEIDIPSEIGKGAMLATRTKAVGHKAALNFGDCFSYAAAKALGVGLLYKGNDFALTDLA